MQKKSKLQASDKTQTESRADSLAHANPEEQPSPHRLQAAALK